MNRLDGSNEDETLSPAYLAGALSSLQLLNLEDNGIESWEQVCVLSSLPRYVTANRASRVKVKL